jgi:hypothetical protein
MDEILSLTTGLDNEFEGYLRRDDRYHRFTFSKGGLKIEDTWEVGEFDSYEHFAMRMGKWDEEAIFLVKPIPIKEINLESLLAASEAVFLVLADDDDPADVSRKLARVVSSPLFLFQPFDFREDFRKQATKAKRLSDLPKEYQEFIPEALDSIGQDVWSMK